METFVKCVTMMNGITEMLDRGMNRTTRTPQVDRNFSRTDRNYHGHLNAMDERTRPSYYRNYNGALAEKIAKRAANVGNVKDARAVVSGDRVVVAVSTTEKIQRASNVSFVKRSLHILRAKPFVLWQMKACITAFVR